MKLIIKLIIFLVVLAVAGPFIMKRPDGRPLVMISDLSGESAILKSFKSVTRLFSSGKEAVNLNSATDEQPLLTTVHRWQDENGNWHFADQLPENILSEKLEIDPNQNILEMNDAEVLKKLQGETEDSVSANDLMPPANMIPGFPTIDQAKKAMDNAKAVQGLLDDAHSNRLNL